ncbi:MAG: helix-turn-helix domain-containing protein [Gammaproteobacteria bacterium]
MRARSEREAIVRALSHSNENITKTARLLGVSRPTLYSLFQKYDIVVRGADDE